MKEIKKKINILLKEAKFETFCFESTPSKQNKYCFDSLVKKDNKIFLVKVFANIDNINENIIKNIKNLSLLLNSQPLLIGIKNRYQNLEDNTIYIRNDLPFITPTTLKNILRFNDFPHILAKRGGGVVFLDGNLMKTLREQKNLSRKEISDQLGVTKRTVCSYENENMRPSQKIAEKIIQILESKSIFRKINLFEWKVRVRINLEKKNEKKELSDFETNLQDIFEHLGISTIWYKKGQTPFELTLSSKNYTLGSDDYDDFYPLFSGVSQEEENNKINKLSINNLVKFANLFHRNALFIVSNAFRIPDVFKKGKIPIVKLKSLENMENEEDFVEIFKQK
ncbi:MAG: helix-turn-helix domain-containing protein [Promethearchaeota archaeon]